MRRKLVPLTTLVLLLAFLLGVCWKERQDSVETFNVSAVTEEEIKDELIVAVFIESITTHVNNFYSEFYSGQIAVYNYETAVLEIEKTDHGLITVKFGVTPMIGAHNPLGYDELTYSIDSAGKGRLENYEHIKSETIPERFEEYIIKPFGADAL